MGHAVSQTRTQYVSAWKWDRVATQRRGLVDTRSTFTIQWNSQCIKILLTPQYCRQRRHGTCYEGAYAGNAIYSTDSTCGSQYDTRIYAAMQGDWCHYNGTCGTGNAFCGNVNCHSGNCTWTDPAAAPVGRPDEIHGNPIDSTCGGPYNLTCKLFVGGYGNKNGICGSEATDCGGGCQIRYETCSATSRSIEATSTKPPTTKTSNTVSKSTSTFTSISRTTTNSSKTTTTWTSKTTPPTTTTTHTSTSTLAAISSLPTCGQTCIHNMLNQYSTVGCKGPDWACLCSNADFNNGVRDCSNGACGSTTGAISIAYVNSTCSSVLATAKPTTPTKPSSTTQKPSVTITDIASLPFRGQVCFNNMLGQHSALGCPTAGDAACICKNANFGYGVQDCANAACSDMGVAGTVISFEGAYCAKATGTTKP